MTCGCTRKLLRETARLAELAAQGDREALAGLREMRERIAERRPQIGAADVGKTRERVRWRLLPSGAIEATMLVTLPDGSTRTFRAFHRPEPQEVAGAMAMTRAWASLSKQLKQLKADYEAGRVSKAEGKRRMAEIRAELIAAKNKPEGISLAGVGRALSKVAKVASKGLAVAALVTPPPINAAAAAAAGTLAVATKLADTAKPAVTAVKEAKQLAEKLAPGASGALLQAANKKRKALAAAALPADVARTIATAKAAQGAALKKVVRQQRTNEAAAKTKRKAKRRAQARARKSGADVVTAARKGLVRSPTGGKVSADELVRAHARGNVFWVYA